VDLGRREPQTFCAFAYLATEFTRKPPLKTGIIQADSNRPTCFWHAKDFTNSVAYVFINTKN